MMWIQTTKAWRTWALAGLVAAWLGLAPAAHALNGPGEIYAKAYDESAQVSIAWKENWDATYKANRDAWQKELGSDKDAARSRWRLSYRLYRLYEAMIVKYPAEADKRLEARKAMVALLESMGQYGRANYARKTIIDSYPGRFDLAGEQLWGILSSTQTRLGQTEEGDEWLDYAIGRVLAMRRAGQLGEDSALLQLALKAQAVMMRAQGRLMEARLALDEMDRLFGPTAESRLLRGQVLLEGGERAALETLLTEMEGSREAQALERAMRDVRGEYPAAPTLPRKLQPEMRWEGLKNRPLAEQADAVSALLADEESPVGLVQAGKDRYVSIWQEVDRYVRGHSPQEIAALRRLHESDVPDFSPVGADPATIQAAFRRWPLASSVHRAMVETAQQALRDGQAGVAMAAFSDVLAHAEAGEIRQIATVGFWMALAQDPANRAQLEAAFATVSPEAQLPWRGQMASAKVIQRRLLEGMEQPPVRPLALGALEVRALETPLACPWPAGVINSVDEDVVAEMPNVFGQVVGNDEYIVLGGPRSIACFARLTGKLLWLQMRQLNATKGSYSSDGNVQIVPGPFAPALGDGRLYTRWGIDHSERYMTDVAAMDLQSGQILWSTDRQPAWSDIWPISDPTFAQGRVYVLARATSRSSPFAPYYLVAMDARTGALVWKRAVGLQNSTLSLPGSKRRGERVDLAHFGNAVTVHGGAAYCQTNMGFVVKVDARDGMVCWARTYPPARVNRNLSGFLRRQGAAPQVVGRAVILLPRDRMGMFALDTSNGELLWDAPLLASAQLAGVAGQNLIVQDRQDVAAVRAADGQTVWSYHAPAALGGTCQLVGQSLVATTVEGLIRLSVQTGIVQETAPWKNGQPLQGAALAGGALVGVVDDILVTPSLAAGAPLNPQGPERGDLSLPLARMWRYPLAEPVLLDPQGPATSERLLVYGQGQLAALEPTPRGKLLWQRTMVPGHLAIVEEAQRLLVVYPQQVLAVDSKTGATLWRRAISMWPNRWRVCGQTLILGDYDRDRRTIALDLRNGQILWDKRFQDDLDARVADFSFGDIAWDGKAAHLLSPRMKTYEEGLFDVVVRPEDGGIVDVRKVRSTVASLRVGEGFYAYVDKDAVCVSDLAGKVGRCAIDAGELKSITAGRGSPGLRIRDNWIIAEGSGSMSLAVNKDKPATRVLFRGAFRGDEGVWGEVAERVLRVGDARTQKVAEYAVPAISAGRQPGTQRIVGWWVDAKQVYVVQAYQNLRPHWEDSMVRYFRLEVFDRATAVHKGHCPLDGLTPWTFRQERGYSLQNVVTAAGGQVLALDSLGVVAFSHGGQAATDSTSRPATPAPAPSPKRGRPNAGK